MPSLSLCLDNRTGCLNLNHELLSYLVDYFIYQAVNIEGLMFLAKHIHRLMEHYRAVKLHQEVDQNHSVGS